MKAYWWEDINDPCEWRWDRIAKWGVIILAVAAWIWVCTWPVLP